MNQTSATSQTGDSLLPAGTGALTAVHFVLIALVALAALAIIVSGLRRARARKSAMREMERHAQEAGVPPPIAADAAPEVAPEPTAPEPAAFAPVTAVNDAVPEARSTGSAEADGPVTQLKGLGPKVAARLAELGITTVGQVAVLDEAQAAALDTQLGPFSGRMARDRWIEQARLLVAGDRAGFESAFGRL